MKNQQNHTYSRAPYDSSDAAAEALAEETLEGAPGADALVSTSRSSSNVGGEGADSTPTLGHTASLTASPTHAEVAEAAFMAMDEGAPEALDLAALLPPPNEASNPYGSGSRLLNDSPEWTPAAHAHGQPLARALAVVGPRAWGFDQRRELRQRVAKLDSHGLNHVLKIVYPGEPIQAGKVSPFSSSLIFLPLPLHTMKVLVCLSFSPLLLCARPGVHG